MVNIYNYVVSIEITNQEFGDATEKAVMDFQSSNKLNPDGIAGQKTFKALGIPCVGGGGAGGKW